MKLSRITEYNTWWDTGKVREDLCPPFERKMIERIINSFNDRTITILRGARRTGKSTLLYQSIRHLLGKAISPENILYFTFDDEKGTITELLDEYGDSVLQQPFDSFEKLYIFIDEIQKCENWAEQIKRTYDLYPNIKFVLSGSVSFDIGARTIESLAGRTGELILYPMSFGEYLGIRGIEAPHYGDPLKKFLLAERRVKPYFRHYLMTGGLPEIAGEKDLPKIKDYIETSILRRAIYGDLLQLGEIGDPESMMALVRGIAEFPGMILNYERLGSDIGKDRRTVSGYITKLEFSMIIRTLGNIRGSGLSSSRKLRKAYPVSSALTFAFKGSDLDEIDLGRVVEIAILNEIKANYFWRYRGYEVDFILGNRGETAVEVKFGKSRRFDFDQYGKKHTVANAFAITKNEHGIGVQDNINYRKIPAWALCAGADIKKLRSGL